MNAMANGTFVNYSEIASFKFDSKNNLGIFSLKKSNTLSSVQCEVTDRPLDVRQTWKTLCKKIIIITAGHFMH